MFKAYWLRVHQRALSATRKFLGLESWGQIVLRALAAIAVVSALFIWGSEDAATDELIFRGAGICLVLALFPLTYAWNFSRAPAEMDQEKQQDIINLTSSAAKLTAQLEKKQTNRLNVLSLSILIEKGHELTVKRISAENYEEWKTRLRVWEILTLKFLASFISHQDAVSFKNVHYHKTERFIFNISNDHNQDLQETTVRLKTLKGIMERHQENWSPLNQQERSQIEARLTAIEAQVVAADSL